MRALLIILILFALGCSETPTSNCQVIRYDLAHRPNHLIQASNNFVTASLEDDYRDLDAALLSVPVQYELALEIGTPQPTSIQVVADTGSANLIVQSTDCPGCVGSALTPSLPFIGSPFTVSYGVGGGTANKYEDLVGFTCGEPVALTFGILSQNTYLPNIMGLAYSRVSSTQLPSFFDDLITKYPIANRFSLTLCGEKQGSQLVLGDNNAKADLNQMQFAPITTETYYVVPFKSMKVKDADVSLGNFQDNSIAGKGTILDSGTTLNLIPQAMFDALRSYLLSKNVSRSLKIPDRFFAQTSPNEPEYAIQISSQVLAQLPTLQVEVRSTSGSSFWIDLPPDVYLTDLGKGNRVFGFRPTNGVSILGQAFMQSSYLLFDRANKRVGFGPLTGLCT